MDATKNFAKSDLDSGIAAGATSLVLTSGGGAKFPLPSTDGAFNLTLYNKDYPDPADDPDVEVVRCTARSTDTLTVARAQEGTADVNHNTGGKTYAVILGPTAKLKTDITAEAVAMAVALG